MKGLWHISFSNAANPPFVSGDIVRVFYNEILDVFFVTKNGSEITTGPTLGPASSFIIDIFGGGSRLEINYIVFPMDDQGNPALLTPGYQFCELTTLVKFGDPSTAFPYAQKSYTPNDPSCAGNVCDIIFRGAPQLVLPSEPTVGDGSITIVAQSSLGTVRYGLENKPYAEMSNTTGVFTDLYAGAYVIYAKDPNGCTVVLQVQLNAIFNYGIRYRLQYTDSHKGVSRIDILQRDYLGVIEEIKGADTPFSLFLRGENQDFFNPILSTSATARLISETDFQFLELFTQDDRQYQCRYYKQVSGFFEEKWRGWIIPGLYQEQYDEKKNYYVSAEFTDNLSILKDLPFVDSSGNKITGRIRLIEIIATILKKTDLGLPIRSACNIFEAGMDSSVDDDPLEQTYIDVDKAYVDEDGTPLKCLDVLDNILRSFGARIFQFEGLWRINRIDEHDDFINFRVFDQNGVFISSGSYDPIKNLKSPQILSGEMLYWVRRSQNLEIQKAIGFAEVTFNLKKQKFGIRNGGFDEITPPTSIPGQMGGYPGWTLVLNGNTASWLYITNNAWSSSMLSGRDDKYALFFTSASDRTDYGQDAYVVSENKQIRFTKSDGIVFSFDYLPMLIQTLQDLVPPFIKFKFSFTVDNQYYLQADGTWSTDTDFQWIEVNVPSSKFDEWQTIEIATALPDVAAETATTFNVRIMHGSFPYSTWVIGDEADLRDVPTIELPEGYVHVVKSVSAGVTTYRFYELISTTLPDNSPQIIRPDDYGTFNPPAWSSLTTYKRNDKVSSGPNFYVSTQDNNVGHSPIFGTFWAQMAGRVAWSLKEELVTGILETPGFYGVRSTWARKFDNVNMTFLPSGQSAPDKKSYRVDNKSTIKDSATIEILNGDSPPDIMNAENIYENFYRRSDGQPTKSWKRVGMLESQPLLALLAKQYVEQFKRPKLKLTGSISGTFFLPFDSAIKESSRLYLPTYFELDDFNCQYQTEMIELTPVDNGTLNPFGPAEFVTAEFGQDYDI
jgi:hypothetical protein